MGATFNLKKKTKQNKTKAINLSSWREGQTKVREMFLFFSFKYSLFDSRSSDRWISSGQTRKMLYVMRATRENKKHGISPRIPIKIRKKPSF